jgi:hypothetical protein
VSAPLVAGGMRTAGAGGLPCVCVCGCWCC